MKFLTHVGKNVIGVHKAEVNWPHSVVWDNTRFNTLVFLRSLYIWEIVLKPKITGLFS